MKRKRTNIERNSRVRRQRDPIPWKYCVLTVVCGLLLVSGFFMAAKQHFTTVQIGMDNAELRMRVAKLKYENRKLLISKERASTPTKIAKLAAKHGFREKTQIALGAPVNVSVESADPIPRRVAAFTEKKVEIQPVSYRDALEKTRIKSTRANRIKKANITDDQIAALLTDDD